MIKKHLKMLILTSIIILIPVLVGLMLWNRLPDRIATHWNAEGIADGFSSKPVAVFALPAVLLAVHWLCVAVTGADPKAKNIDSKPVMLVMWISPVLSLILMSISYATALGYNVSVEMIMPLLLGIMFIAIGNYLPKCKQNYTIGIKVPWTLNDEDNWNKTHRFAGIIWVIGGVIIMATAFLGSFVVFMPVMLIMTIAPMVYSYLYYRKNNNK